MSRKVDENIKEEILNKVLQAITIKGLNNLSLRDIAKETGINARMLIYHFKSYDLLINSVFIKLSKNHKTALKAVLAENSGKNLDELFQIFIDRIYLNEHSSSLVLFMELYTKALRNRDAYTDFFQEVLHNWIEEIGEMIKPKYGDKAKIYATLIVSFYRGLMLDWLATMDSKRAEDTNRVFSRILNNK